MATEAANGNNHVVTKKPPTPSPLRNSKFFQSNMRILVTGGAGFIGSHLVDKLMENEKNEVIVADNFFTGSKDNLRKWIGHPRFELIRHDITEPLLVEVDQIYHLACPASPIFYKHNPVKTIKTNVMGTMNMLGLAKRVGARILLTSTSEVYGDPLEHPQTEEYWGNVNPIGVRSCYDEGKRVAETLMFDYHRQHGIEIRIARIFNTYGPRMNIDDGRVVSNFIAQALRGESLTVQAPGTQTRSFCYVSDMVDGLIRLMEGENTGPINLGNPGEFTMMELAEVVKELIEPSISIKIVENTPDDPRQRKPNITKAKQLLGWEPKITLRQGLPLMEEDFKQRLGGFGRSSRRRVRPSEGLIKMVRVSVLNDALKSMYNAEKRGKRQVMIRPSSKVIIKFLLVMQKHGYIGEFEYVDDHRAGKIVVELNGRLNKCGVISPRFDVGVKEIEPWTARLLPSRQFGYIVLTTSAGIMDHEEARRKNVGGKDLKSQSTATLGHKLGTTYLMLTVI
ncbi:hypothetical protein OPV22_020949 [Ensete ventricosum]|uniref:Small ribosomal subunit protein uS8c n=1 Tax=Ensete ventricosum TaxID=4639 RepID=A0AAV8QG18_ENSVE|nr:hypothetical protein OPV22_020949 [Ensete ventricosum]